MTGGVTLGDCLDVARTLPDAMVDLVYLDPPFFTQRTHRQTTRDGEREFAFEDRWDSINHYAGFLRARLLEFHRLLRSSGSLFFHCDRNASHIARALLDEVFGSAMFRSEIIWHYRRWSYSQRNLLPAHQTIFFYSKSDDYKFKTTYVEYSPSTNVDQLLQKRRRGLHGKSEYARDDSGEVIAAGAKNGVPLGDVWDIPYLNPKAAERVGYPTQKPLLLLDRIIELCTSPGDSVLDPFCGSGTTLVSAERLGRVATGIDIAADAVEMTRRRLASPVRTESALLEAGRESYASADKEALGLLAGLDYVPVHRNKGFDAILKQLFNGQVVPVRVQRAGESIGDAVRALVAAGRSKRAERMILVVTHEGGEFPFGRQWPPEIVLVEATALRIHAALENADRASQGPLGGDAVVAKSNGTDLAGQ